MHPAFDLLLRIEEFAVAARSELEKNAHLFEPYGSFPRGACGPVSEVIGRCIEERFGVQGLYVCGSRHPNLRAEQSHAWLTVGDVVIDVTHDQFANTGLGKRWVLIGSTWHDAFDEKDVPRPVVLPESWPLYPYGVYALLNSIGRR